MRRLGTIEVLFLAVLLIGGIVIAIRDPDQAWRDAAIPGALALGFALGRLFPR